MISALLHHRGPDDAGYEVGEGWGLGFQRLSILDLSPFGHQPMISPCGRYRIVFNGEIYNYVELREKLMRQGEYFTGGSDTEVLLRLLAREGVASLQQLNGMFALALIDLRERKFILARDRLGVKPLYYSTTQGSLCFASEMKGLLPLFPQKPDLNRDAVVQSITLGYLPDEAAIFAGVHKLPPACYLAGFSQSRRKLCAYAIGSYL